MMRTKLIFLFCLFVSVCAWAEPIASVEVTDGTVTVTRVNGKRLIVAVGSTLEEGDTISTEKDSYARLKFTDGSEVSVRPGSTLAIQQYHFENGKPLQDNLLMRVVKGGMRTISGMIGKRGNADAYRVQGGTATIGIRGTEYIARVCDGDCQVEQKSIVARNQLSNNPQNIAKKKPMPLPVAARIVEFDGQVRVINGNKSRLAALGEALYSGETILVSNPGHASLLYNDQTRVVLNPGSEFELTSVRYNPAAPDSGNILSRLVKGGMRMVTGLFGKRHPEHVKVETTVATIGIRGTNFDLLCSISGNLTGAKAELSENAPVQCDGGIFAFTREGAIELRSGIYLLIVPAGKVGYVDSPGAPPTLLEGIPLFLRNNALPLPEDMDVNMPQTFGVDGTQMHDAGFYVAVVEGKIALTQESGEIMLLQPGETGFASATGVQLLRLGTEPVFIEGDAYLRELRVDPATCRAQ